MLWRSASAGFGNPRRLDRDCHPSRDGIEVRAFTDDTALLHDPQRRGIHEPVPAQPGLPRSTEALVAVQIEADAAEEIARRSRGTPRVANRILRRVRDVAEVRHQGVVTTEIAHEAPELLEVDEHGLERADRALLEAIVEKFGGGPVGLSTLAVALGEEPDTIEDVYETYLLQLGFIQRTPRGRIVTDLGRDHVGATAAADVARAAAPPSGGLPHRAARLATAARSA
jgi:holliday junction DNA helicase RuvB